MKRILLLACIAGMAVSPALAGMTAHLSAGHGDPFPIGQGGYYTVYRTGDMAAWNAAGLSADFRTFCVEQRVFYDGTQYNVTIDDQVLQLGPKPIQTFTKTLYANYILAPGSTIGQNTIGESGFSNRAFQALIWDSQGTISGTAGQFGGGHANAYAWLTGPEKLLYITYHDFAVNNPRTSDLWRVHALNLWSGTPYTGGDMQSQLVLTVPAPAAALLGAVGLGLVGWIKRRVS